MKKNKKIFSYNNLSESSKIRANQEMELDEIPVKDKEKYLFKKNGELAEMQFS